MFAGAAGASPTRAGAAGPESPAWIVQSTPNPAAAVQSYLQGVSCTSASACTAVGYYENSSLQPYTLAERWNGKSWSIQSIPSPGGPSGSYLYGVSCTSATACTAVGYYTSTSASLNTLAEAWNGKSWKVQATPQPHAFGRLSGVSCTSASACTAVGDDVPTGTGSYVTLAERWDGTSWTAQTTHNPAGSSSPQLSGVSCASASACTAAGYYGKGTETLALAEGWNGKTWAIHATPSPAHSANIFLYGASCTSASACTAAGAYDNTVAEAQATLAERWNGTAWKVQATPNPNPTSPGTELYGVSCTSASACITAGWYEAPNGAEETLAEGWNGTAWASQATPSPSKSSNYLNGVSCTTASACTAVGDYTTSSGIVKTLAEHE